MIPVGPAGDELLEQVLADLQTIRVGDPLAEIPNYIGTLISEAAADQGIAFVIRPPTASRRAYSVTAKYIINASQIQSKSASSIGLLMRGR